MRNFIFLSIIFFYSCSEKKEKLPEGLLGKQQLIEVLSDAHLAEAAFTGRNMMGEMNNNYAGSQYEQVFKTHNTTKEQFVKSLKYYSTQPKELEEIYNEVLNELSKKEAMNLK